MSKKSIMMDIVYEKNLTEEFVENKLKEFEAEMLDKAMNIVERVAHIGVDFGYGEYALGKKDIKEARELLEQLKQGD